MNDYFPPKSDRFAWFCYFIGMAGSTIGLYALLGEFYLWILN